MKKGKQKATELELISVGQRHMRSILNEVVENFAGMTTLGWRVELQAIAKLSLPPPSFMRAYEKGKTEGNGT